MKYLSRWNTTALACALALAITAGNAEAKNTTNMVTEVADNALDVATQVANQVGVQCVGNANYAGVVEEKRADQVALATVNNSANDADYAFVQTQLEPANQALSGDADGNLDTGQSWPTGVIADANCADVNGNRCDGMQAGPNAMDNVTEKPQTRNEVNNAADVGVGMTNTAPPIALAAMKDRVTDRNSAFGRASRGC